MNPFIIDISPIRGIEVVKPNPILSDGHGAVHRRYFGVINSHVRPAAHVPNACFWFRQSVRRPYRPPLNDADRDGPVERRSWVSGAKSLAEFGHPYVCGRHSSACSSTNSPCNSWPFSRIGRAPKLSLEGNVQERTKAIERMEEVFGTNVLFDPALVSSNRRGFGRRAWDYPKEHRKPANG